MLNNTRVVHWGIVQSTFVYTCNPSKQASQSLWQPYSPLTQLLSVIEIMTLTVTVKCISAVAWHEEFQIVESILW